MNKLTQQSKTALAKPSPEQADGAQGERERFKAWYERTYGVRAFAQNVDHSYVEPLTEMQWAGWQARAALAQPSPAPELDDQAFDINAERLTFQALGPGAGINPEATSIDDIFIDEAPAPDQSEQPLAMVELEWPEAVAFLLWPLKGSMAGQRFTGLGDIPADANRELYGYERLMTVAQHERIVTAWRHLKDVKYAELYEEAVQLEAKIDAAQAKLAELERQGPVYTKPSWADSYGWSGGYIDFKCATDVEKLARHFEDLLDAVPEGPLYAAPACEG